MRMSPAVRELVLTGHVAVSVGWIGALAAFLAHSLASRLSHDDFVVRAASASMGLIAWYVILPLCIATLATGVMQALGTAWGLFRHYWVLFKLILTAAATVVLLLKLAPISHLAEASALAGPVGESMAGLRTSVLVHAIGGLAVLLAALSLAIYKPEGLTRYGRERVSPAAETPLWVKVLTGALAVLLIVIGAMLLVGGHGPAAHG